MSESEAPPVAPARDAGAGGGSLLAALQALLRELPGMVSDRVRLVSLELRRAGIALAQIVALAVAIAVLLVTAWLAIWVGLSAAAITAGIPWGWVLVLVLAINLGAAWLALRRARSLLGLIGLPATVRRLTVAPSSSSSTDQDETADAYAAARQPVVAP